MLRAPMAMSRKQRTVAAATAPDSRLCPIQQGAPRKRTVSDEAVLNGILFVLQTGILWEDLPQFMGFGSGMTCWRRLRDWHDADSLA